MAKLIYEKPELITLIGRDSAMGRCQNGSVNIHQACQSGSVALAGACTVGTSAGVNCGSGISASTTCSVGSNKIIANCKSGKKP